MNKMFIFGAAIGSVVTWQYIKKKYERLGIPPTKAGQIVAWVYDPDNLDHGGGYC
jgi:hypothetical protein